MPLLAVRPMTALLLVLRLLVPGLVPAPGLRPLKTMLLLKMVPRLVVLAPLVVRRMVVLLTPRQTQRLLLRSPMTAGRLGKPLVRMLVLLLLMMPMLAVLVPLPVQLLLPLLVEKVPRARTHMPVPMLVPMVLLMVTHLIELTLVLQMGLPQVVLVPVLVPTPPVLRMRGLLLSLLRMQKPLRLLPMTAGRLGLLLVPRLGLMLLTPPMMVTMNRTIAAARAMTKTKGTTVKIWTSRGRWQG